MAKKHHVEVPFKWFGWNEDPIGKYKQPIDNHDPTGTGYPAEGVENHNVLVKGRWPSGTKKKTRMEMKGTGAAEHGKRFMVDDKKYSVEE